jgi:hypothetical protein
MSRKEKIANFVPNVTHHVAKIAYPESFSHFVIKLKSTLSRVKKENQSRNPVKSTSTSTTIPSPPSSVNS